MRALWITWFMVRISWTQAHMEVHFNAYIGCFFDLEAPAWPSLPIFINMSDRPVHLMRRNGLRIPCNLTS